MAEPYKDRCEMGLARRDCLWYYTLYIKHMERGGALWSDMYWYRFPSKEP